MSRTEDFLKLFEKLEDHLRHEVDDPKIKGFSNLLNHLAKNPSVLQRNKAILEDYGKLRNALVHQQGPTKRYLAVPTKEALREFEQIVEAITSPKLISMFQKTVTRLFLPQEPLVAALEHMQENDYSQVVVQTKRGLSILTVEGIARWLEEHIHENNISVQQAVIADAWRHELPESFSFMSSNETVYAAMDIFTQAIERGKPRVYALLIMKQGIATEELSGIVTPWDLLNIQI